MVETHDIQGLILSGYAGHPFAAYLFLTLRAGIDPRAWLAQVSERIFVLSAGRLVFDGGPSDFRSSPVVNTLLVGS